jgi:cobalamin biosynthesis protein CobT
MAAESEDSAAFAWRFRRNVVSLRQKEEYFNRHTNKTDENKTTDNVPGAGNDLHDGRSKKESEDGGAVA